MKKLDDLEILKAFKNMRTIGEICKELQIDYANVIQGKTTKENIHKVVQELKLELYKLNLFMGEK